MAESLAVALSQQVRTLTGLKPGDCPLDRLERIVGSERCEEVVGAALRHADLEGVESSQDLLVFGEALSAQANGMVDLTGRALRIEALLGGAIPRS